jgi:hypothetical protein
MGMKITVKRRAVIYQGKIDGEFTYLCNVRDKSYDSAVFNFWPVGSKPVSELNESKAKERVLKLIKSIETPLDKGER